MKEMKMRSGLPLPGLIKDDRGVTAIEYAVIAALMRSRQSPRFSWWAPVLAPPSVQSPANW
jgi:hypothetical protein